MKKKNNTMKSLLFGSLVLVTTTINVNAIENKAVTNTTSFYKCGKNFMILTPVSKDIQLHTGINMGYVKGDYKIEGQFKIRSWHPKGADIVLDYTDKDNEKSWKVLEFKKGKLYSDNKLVCLKTKKEGFKNGGVYNCGGYPLYIHKDGSIGIGESITGNAVNHSKTTFTDSGEIYKLNWREMTLTQDRLYESITSDCPVKWPTY